MKKVLKEWRAEFLSALRYTLDVRSACEEASIDLTTAYSARGRSVKFQREWQEALTDGLEVAAFRFAIEKGNAQLLMFLLKAHRPEKYAENGGSEQADNQSVLVTRGDD